ncbi:MAG: translational GTPase TypA [SAR202 cluster bacterium]|nr:translational GTPase TypA [SAR202 cluster bacterium]
MTATPQQHIRNVAIVAHVDHGKTSLVDAMLKFARVFRENQTVGEFIMDSNPLERERGITILAKNTAIAYKGVTINIIDTPGHVDFSGEVERVVNMADGCLLVVDAVDGPMPQTRYVLRTAMKKGLRPVVVINKVDRANTRIPEVLSAVQDLFLELATESEQLDFPVLYASAREGYAMAWVDDPRKDMEPLFEAILDYIPAPVVDPDGTFQMLAAALDYDNHLGQIVIGRVFRGKVRRGDAIVVVDREGKAKAFRTEHLFIFKDLARRETDEVSAGDIVALSGAEDVTIGDTIAAPSAPEALPRIAIEEPTVKMTFGVNTSPMAGREGTYATSRMLAARLQRELLTNVALRVEATDSADEFLVSGRGELHLAVLIEIIRREGWEIQVSKPEAVTKEIDGAVHEPYERLTIDTREEYVGQLTENLASRLAVMSDMHKDVHGNVRLEYELPTRGLIGFRSYFLRATRGNGVMNSEFIGMRPMKGEVRSTRTGVMVSSEAGVAVSYGIRAAQEHGSTFVDPMTPVYEGMIVGTHNRDADMDINITKEKKMTNVRNSTAEILERLVPAIKFSLEEALDYILADELVEVTPQSIRMRKRVLSADARHRLRRESARAVGAR